MKKFNIYKFKPCLDAIEYYDTCKSSEKAWNNCPRGDWMLWIASKLGVDIKILTLTKVHCALTVRHLIKDKRSIKALEVALKFANGKATLKELKIADSAAHVAAHINYANAAHAAAYACANATNAAAYITNATDTVNTIANAAAYVAAYAADAANADANYTDAAKIKNQLKTANICRKYLTESVCEIINKFY